MSKANISRIILTSLAIGTVFTSPTALAYGGTGWGPITMLTIYRGTVRTGALIQPSATFTNNDNCTSPGSLFIDFSTTETPDGKALYAMALAAQVSGKSISIGTLGCSSEGFPIVYGINIQ